MTMVVYYMDAIEKEFRVLNETYQMVKSERDSLAARYDDALKRIHDLQAELEFLRMEVNRQ